MLNEIMCGKQMPWCLVHYETQKMLYILSAILNVIIIILVFSFCIFDCYREDFYKLKEKYKLHGNQSVKFKEYE